MKHQLKSIQYIVLLVLCSVFSPSYANSMNQPAQDFTLKSRSGENIRLQELTGQVVFINFWASWCAPCRKELPKLEELHQKYKDLGVSILGINIDENPELSKKILKDVTVTFPVLFDPDGAVSGEYKIEAMPSSFIMDKNGVLRYRHNGYMEGYELKYDKQIMQLIRE